MRTDLEQAISTFVDSTRTQYLLGRIQATQEEHGRRISDREAEHKALKADHDKLKTWIERGSILLALYVVGTGLHLSAGTVGPILATAFRAALSLR